MGAIRIAYNSNDGVISVCIMQVLFGLDYGR